MFASSERLCMHIHFESSVFHLTVGIFGCVFLIGDVLLLCSQGRQEDAEEYLGFTLNGLHEEMLALKKLISPQEESKHVYHFTKSYHKAHKVFIDVV